VFLYVSCATQIGAGSWRKTRSRSALLAGASKAIPFLAVIGCIILVIVGVQPPNEEVGSLFLAGIIAMIIIWHLVEKNRFAGPPLTEGAVRARQAEIAREEAALGGAG
jgi:hypothetical protein